MFGLDRLGWWTVWARRADRFVLAVLTRPLKQDHFENLHLYLSKRYLGLHALYESYNLHIEDGMYLAITTLTNAPSHSHQRCFTSLLSLQRFFLSFKANTDRFSIASSLGHLDDQEHWREFVFHLQSANRAAVQEWLNQLRFAKSRTDHILQNQDFLQEKQRRTFFEQQILRRVRIFLTAHAADLATQYL